jgi:hypothetical protein
MVSIKRAQPYHQPVCGLARPLVCLIVCGWLALVQPGLSYYWLIDPYMHAKIDAERYDQLPDGRMLPGHPYHPPHEHPGSGGLSITHLVMLETDASACSRVIFWEAHRPSLQDNYAELAVILWDVHLDPPEPPPRISSEDSICLFQQTNLEENQLCT